MGERRKRKSLWDKEAEVETKPFPKQDSEIHNGVSNLAPKLRDGSVQPSSRSMEKDPIAQMNGRSRENAPQGKEVGGVNSHYQKMSPEFEHNRSLENDRGHSWRHPRRGRSRSRSRSRSRTRGRSRSRSLSRGRERERVRRRSRSRSRSKGRGRTRSRSPLGDNRSQKRSKNEVPCRNFVKGKCRWGDTCRFSHHSASEDASLEGTKRLSSDKDSRWAHSSGDENINLHQNGENVLPPNIDLQPLIEKHQHNIGTKGMLETNASNHVEFPNQRSENEEKNAVGVSQEPLNPRENGRNKNELENHVEKGDNPAPENQESDEAKRVAEQSKGFEKTIHSETLEGQGRGEEDIANKDDKETRLFKNHLIEFVKEILKPTWKEGRMSREVHKTIVKKVVEKITSTIQAEHIPKTQEKVEQYLSFSKPKIAKLVQAYVDRCLKPDS